MLCEDEILYLRLELGFPDAKGIEHPRNDDRIKTISFLKIRLQAALEHVLHLRRRPRQIHDDPAILLQGNARRRPGMVHEDMRPRRDHGLPKIVLRHSALHPGKMSPDMLGTGLIQRKLPAKYLSRYLLRDIPAGRPQTARGNHEIRPGKGMLQCLTHPRPVVSHRRLIDDIKAQRIEPFRHIGGIRVDDLAEQQLAARSHEFYDHLSALSLLPAAMRSPTIS